MFWHDFCFICCMKIAISEWQNRVAPVFDCCQTVVIFSEEQEDRSAGEKLSLPMLAEDKTAYLLRAGIQLLICGAISCNLKREVENNSIKIIPFISGDIQSVVSAFTSGTLENEHFCMPGRTCRKRRWRCKGNLQNNL